MHHSVKSSYEAASSSGPLASSLDHMILEKNGEFMKVSGESDVSPGVLRNASFCESLSRVTFL